MVTLSGLSTIIFLRGFALADGGCSLVHLVQIVALVVSSIMPNLEWLGQHSFWHVWHDLFVVTVHR